MTTHVVPVKVMMYKSSNSQATVIDKAISWWTDSEYSHCEIVIGDKWLSADVSAVVLRDMRTHVNKVKWDIIELEYELTNVQCTNIMKFIKSVEGSKYDKLGIAMSQFIKLGVDRSDRWFCSELVAKVLQFAGDYRFLVREPHRLSPGDVSEILTGKR